MDSTTSSTGEESTTINNNNNNVKSTDSSYVSNPDAEAWKDKGNKFMQESAYNDAIQAYTESIKIDPNHHIYYSNRSAAYFSVGNFEKSVADAAECVRLAPNWSKGYNRLSTALLKLEKHEEASFVCQKGLEVDSNNANLIQTLKRIKQIHDFELLKGKWHGTVNEAVGGYIQEFDFINEEDVILTVLGNQVSAKYELDASASPGHLDMNVPSQPHLPTVRHIYKFEKFDETSKFPMELHLCSPYLTDPNTRPTTFGGPAYVVMHRGSAAASVEEIREQEAIAKLSDEEKMALFLKEAIDFTPKKFCLPLEGDPDTLLSEKMTASVKFQSKYQKIRNKYGEMIEAVVKQMVIGDIKPPNASIQGLVTEFRDRMKIAGLFGTPEEAQEVADAAAKAASSSRKSDLSIDEKLLTESSTKSNAPSKQSADDSRKNIKASKTPSKATPPSDSSSYYLSLAVISVCIGIAVASAAYLSSKSNSRR